MAIGASLIYFKQASQKSMSIFGASIVLVFYQMLWHILLIL